MALRTHLRVEKTKESAKTIMEESADELHKVASENIAKQGGGKGLKGVVNNKYPGGREPPKTGVAGFVRAFGISFRKDFG